MSIRFKQLTPGELFETDPPSGRVWRKMDMMHADLLDGAPTPATFYPNEPVKKILNQNE